MVQDKNMPPIYSQVTDVSRPKIKMGSPFLTETSPRSDQYNPSPEETFCTTMFLASATHFRCRYTG